MPAVKSRDRVVIVAAKRSRWEKKECVDDAKHLVNAK